MVTLYCAEPGIRGIESDYRCGQAQPRGGTRLRRVPRVFKRCLIAALLALLVVAVPGARADEPLPKGFQGTFKLTGTNGYRLLGVIGSTGTEGGLTLFVGKRGDGATYAA